MIGRKIIKTGEIQMKKQILIFIALLIFMPYVIKAQTDEQPSEDERAIKQIIQNLVDAWAAGDGKKWADQFTDDVDYTVWNGRYSHGREANMKGHQYLFDTIYKGSKLNIEIVKMRFLGEAVAVVHLTSVNERDGKQIENVPLVRPLMVLSKEKGAWKIVVFQNTPVIKDGDLNIKREEK